MLGNAVLRFFAASPGYSTVGTVRSAGVAHLLPKHDRTTIVSGVDVENADTIAGLFERCRPDVVINCVGVVKQLAEAGDPLTAIPINGLLPHRLLRLCKLVGARLVHISTDCVFSGSRGMYCEDDAPDATDLYGLSKLLGEVETPAITLRTSLIGPELGSAHGLLEWFLSQRDRAKGFTRAVFSGLPTVELARVIRDVILPREQLHGVYHVGAAPINKHDLLCMIAGVYGKLTVIEPDGTLVIDRSLDATRFREVTGYVAPSWPELIKAMHEYG